jgi:hypothetical protein
MKQSLLTSVLRCGVSALLICTSLTAAAQYGESASFSEAGITVGPSNFLGDLGGNMGKGTRFLKDNNIPMTKMTIGGFFSYHLSPALGFRAAINIGSLEGDDAIINGKGGMEEYRKIRNSNFKSKLFEGLLLAEFYPTTFFEYDPSDNYKTLRPYLVAGIGMFKFNPQGQDPLTGNWVDLKPLRTEGQGMPQYPERKEYNLTQMNVPLGIGVKYQFNETMNLSFEIIHRQTFTDYIDDVSTRYIDPALFYQNLPVAQAQLAERMANKTGTPLSRVFDAGDIRGNPKQNDAYYTAGFKLGIRLGDGNNRWRNSTKCPIKF